ncbi:5'-nucleotidase C-terminal domain-containing protein [Brevibacterium sediminis]|uniref:bifunctional metallophosphatase/5'-nucleotidase n=1 Tax=Brevibacterium sediminis TaxID=1857024 RepID=UPI002174EA20|nr:5'-nucleotidase C-terminal domain-containing protein [Brevibacterium sediminis]MCS4591684.1 5'-nucleotidase C-terminal domain-containing protein [Brevibacterium sediminis]
MRLRTLTSFTLALALIVTGPAAASATGLGSADAPADSQAATTGELTLLATTDVHGNVLNWDYFANKPYPAGEELGMSRASTLIKGVREDKGADSVLLVDNGDTIQGNPLAYYFAKQEPITTSGQTHPLAKTFNHLGYDAQVVGNHEFNYGLDLLATYRDQIDFPLLGANVIDDADGQTHLDPYAMVDKQVDGETITVGVLGVTTPGSRIWDKNNLSGKVHFDDPVETAQKYVPEMKQKGADVIVVLSHSGKDPKGQSWDPDQLQENVSTSVAKVPGVDVLVAGHTHQNEPSQVVNRDDGTQVLITQPNYWARSVSEVGLPINLDTHHVDWGEAAPHADALATQGEVAEDQEIKDLVDEQHQTTIDYVNTKIGSVTETLSAKTSYYEDTAILDFISHVQTETVEEGLKGTDYADLPVISQASPFSRTAEFPAGDITIRDVAGLYVYDNTLAGVEINGAQLRDYLEYSARYFKQTEEGAEFDPIDGTNAIDEVSESPIPDYNYDALAGIDYDINVSKPTGKRIENLTQADGSEIGDDDRFILAINNYRQSGGGGYPVDGLKEVYNEQVEVRQALIDWAEEKQIVDPADFFDENWKVVTSSRAPGGDDDDSGYSEDSDSSGEATAEAGSKASAGAESDAGGSSDGAGSGSSGSADGEDNAGEATSENDGSTNSASDGNSDGGDADGREADGSATGAGGGADLPRTGLELATSIGIAAAIIALGSALVVISRRRRR